MKKKRVSIVSYFNALPFKYGLAKTGFKNHIELHNDTPAQCAEKLISHDIDIGLIPIISIPKIKHPHIISHYCIGAINRVKTVALYSNVPLEEISTIHLDYQSRTSVALVKLLAENYWKIPFNYESTKPGYESNVVIKNNAAVIIGDRNFIYESKFKYKIDLAEEWIKYTDLPMVFACWVANKKIDDNFINDFNDALSVGVNNIVDAVNYYDHYHGSYKKEIEKYLRNNIDFILDNKKIEGLNHFLNLCNPNKKFNYTI